MLKTFIQALIKIKDSILVILKRILSLLKLFIFGKSNKEPNKIALAFEKHAFLYQIPLSLLLCFCIEWMSRRSFLGACSFVRWHLGPFLYNSFIIFVFYMLVFLGTKRTAIRFLVTGFFVIMGAINGVVLSNRVTPFGFTDINMVGDLLTMQDSQYFSAQEAFLVILCLLAFLLILLRFTFSGTKTTPKHKLVSRIAVVVLSFALLWPTTFVLQHTKILTSYFGNLAQGYLDYGYLYGFSTSMLDRGISKPIAYSDTVVSKIIASDDNGPTSLTSEDGPNVIIVLLESYFDPTEAKFLSFSEDPIPYYHMLQQNFSSGHLTVPVVGAGTCNTEFEVLTGMSCQFFGPGEYPQKTVLKKRSCESVADIMGGLGYGTHVVHDNGGNFYSRANAFSQMGFDSFISKELLDITEYTPIKSWPTDDVLIQATTDSLDDTEGPDFVYTITVGTHGAYPNYKVLDNPAIKVTAEGKTQEEAYMWEYYVNQLHTMDKWIENYIKMLSARDEDTLLIMFGDHLPTMGLTADEVECGDLFKTGYVTWNNFDMPKEDADLTSYQLASEYLGRLGVHDGTIINYNQKRMAENVPAGSIRYMTGLEQLQYDLLYGKRYAYDGEDPYPASDLEMGINDIEIDRMYAFGGKVYIYGKNFTNWTKVFVNDVKVATTYKSGEVLTINLDSISNGDKVVVNAMGSGDTIFRSSNSMTFVDPNLELAEDDDGLDFDLSDSETPITE